MRRGVYYIDPRDYVEGEGYRVSVVFEDEPGRRLTGTWPYTGAPGETCPYFWGHDLEKARAIARDQNAQMGFDEAAVDRIVARSIGRTSGRRRRR